MAVFTDVLCSVFTIYYLCMFGWKLSTRNYLTPPPSGVFTHQISGHCMIRPPIGVYKHVHLLECDMVLDTLYSVKVVHLILSKIINFVATRCHILMLKCTKFNFSWGFAPNLAGRAYSAPPDPLAGFNRPISIIVVVNK